MGAIGEVLALRPVYRWGFADERYVDCSGFCFLVARRAGKMVRRVNAAQMAEGRGGWAHERVDMARVDDGDLIWFGFPGGREYGHVGFWYRGGLAHASSARRGVVCAVWSEYFRRYVMAVGRLR